MENVSAAASARLCVETSVEPKMRKILPAAASARLCVETALFQGGFCLTSSSRLRAAVC